ncbi:MAG: TIGR04372 family glycosyltransferase [Nitrospira sp.]
MRVGCYWIIKPYEAFGNRAEDLYFALLKCRRDGLRLIILKRKWDLFGKVRFRNANKQLLNIRHPLVVDNPALELFNYLLTVVLSILRIVGIGIRKACSLLGFRTSNWCVELSDQVFGQAGLWGEATVPFDVKNVTIDWGRELEEKVQVQYRSRAELERVFPDLTGKKFVCLHVRTGGFFDDHDYSSPRNANINNYIPALRELTNRGYVVVRLGDPAMPPLHLDHVLDYAHSRARSEKHDVLLVEHCEFYIGSLTGPIDLAGLFEKRILTVNCLSLSHCMWYRRGSLFIPKQAVLGNRSLTLKEQIDRHLFEIRGTGQMVDGVTYLENSSSDILEAVKEFLLSPDIREEQTAFNCYLSEKVLEYFHATRIWESAEDDASQKLRWAPRLLAARGSICAGYLKEHWQ